MQNKDNFQFVLRVYGLMINGKNEILLSDEYLKGMKMTKFPGGGLEPGEGPVDCIKREMMEEMQQEINVIRHFYTTDYYQKAMFYKNAQLISIYYLVEPNGPLKFKTSQSPFDFELKECGQSFRWQAIESLNAEDLTFPIDKKVADLLKKAFS